MGAQHTPGRWLTKRWSNAEAMIHSFHDGRRIHVSGPACNDDAVLMSASKELLGAAQIARAWFAAIEPSGRTPEQQRVLNALADAITKATGGQHD